MLRSPAESRASRPTCLFAIDASKLRVSRQGIRFTARSRCDNHTLLFARFSGRPCIRLIQQEVEATVQVHVRDNNVDQALRALKKKLQREGVFREMKLRRHFEKPSERKKREQAEAVRRHRKLLRKRMEREGF